MNYQSLTTTLENQPGVTYSEVTDGYPVIHIKNNAASASIALHGAHLIDFKPNGEKPVIFTSESAIYREGKAIRGGIPICWPYFNAHPTHSNFPSHGIARNRFWNLVSIEAEQHCHSLTFEMPISEEDQLLIGGPCNLIMVFDIAESLTISLTTTNTGTENLTIGGALHTYFNIGEIGSTSISGLDGVSHLNTLTDETSTHYGDDTSQSRTINIDKENSLATTIWNPWIEKSSGMSDLGNQDYKKFVCIEAINWKDDLRTLAPKQSHSLVQKISLGK